MARLPLLSGRELVKIFSKIGYSPARQSGSHMRLTCKGRKPITIPDHDSVGRGLLRKIIRDAKLSLSEFKDLLK